MRLDAAVHAAGAAMRDVEAILFLVAIFFAIPAFLLRFGRESARLLWRLLFFVAMANLTAVQVSSEHGGWRWLFFAASFLWWCDAGRCWTRMEEARKREALVAKFAESGRTGTRP